MLIAQKVNNFITSLKPKAVYDKCILNEMKFNSPAHAAQITAALGTTSDFEREQGECSSCKADKLVIRAA